MATTLTNQGKIFCYLNSYDNGKNSSGGTSRPSIQLSDGGYYDYSRIMEIGDFAYDSTRAVGCKKAASKNIYIDIDNQSNNLSTVFKGSYNYDHSDVSYTNPIIMHATRTYLNTGSKNESITKVYLDTYINSCVNTGFTDSGNPRRLVISDVDVELRPGDTVTFTITVK